MGDIVETLHIPSQETVAAMYQMMTCKFQLNNFQTVVQMFPNRLDVRGVKIDMGKKFVVDPKYFNLWQNCEQIEDSTKLCDVELNEFSIIEFELKLSDIAHDYNETVLKKDRIKLDAEVFYRQVK